jgi:hypothetical protein
MTPDEILTACDALDAASIFRIRNALLEMMRVKVIDEKYAIRAACKHEKYDVYVDLLGATVTECVACGVKTKEWRRG